MGSMIMMTLQYSIIYWEIVYCLFSISIRKITFVNMFLFINFPNLFLFDIIFQVGKLISEKMVVILTKQTITHVYTNMYAFNARQTNDIVEIKQVYFHLFAFSSWRTRHTRSPKYSSCANISGYTNHGFR